MLPLSRVVWREGMHIAQHHFQVQSRYFENSINFALSNLFFKSYGLVACILDDEALRNGTLALVHARGVMPDGLIFHFPEGDALPAAREIKELFSPTQHRHTVLLAIPPYRLGASNCRSPGEDDGDVRFLSEESEVLDETTGRDKKPVSLGRKNFRLLLDIEPAEELVTLPIARVVRDGSGEFAYDPDYVTPCLQIGASSQLLGQLRRLIEILEAKRDSLTEDRRADHKSLADFAAHDVASFWLLHAIQSALAPLRHMLEVRQNHPEQLYLELVRVAGALCTFHLDSHPRDLPNYDHDRPDEVFGQLESHIRSHLDVIIPKNCISIPLKRERPLLFTGVVVDKRCFRRAEWILGVRSESGESTVIKGVPKLVKICSAQFISRVVKEARTALALAHLTTPPSDISPRIGSHYFRINRVGPCWDAIQKSEAIGIYVPDAFSDVELELQVIISEE